MIHGINAPRSVWGVEVFEFYDLVTDRQRDAHSFHKQTNVSSVRPSGALRRDEEWAKKKKTRETREVPTMISSGRESNKSKTTSRARRDRKHNNRVVVEEEW